LFGRLDIGSDDGCFEGCKLRIKVDKIYGFAVTYIVGLLGSTTDGDRLGLSEGFDLSCDEGDFKGSEVGINVGGL